MAQSLKLFIFFYFCILGIRPGECHNQIDKINHRKLIVVNYFVFCFSVATFKTINIAVNN